MSWVPDGIYSAYWHPSATSGDERLDSTAYIMALISIAASVENNDYTHPDNYDCIYDQCLATVMGLA